MRIGVLGATGYTGQELLRLLRFHPEAEVVYLGSSSQAGKPYAAGYPHLYGLDPGLLADEKEVPSVDVLFCALPHGLTAARATGLLARGIKLIDLGADFRLRAATIYQQWYKLEHPAPELIPQGVYGLPELYRAEIRGKSLVANPGCYPTATLLALVPLLRGGLIVPETIIVDAKSGVSGAGRGTSQAMHYAEVNENFKAYGVAEHRHTPEIEQELSRAAGQEVRISFTPHLVPMNRGLLATIYASVLPGVSEEDLRAAWREQYADEEFICFLPDGVWPQTKFALGSNRAYLQLRLDERTGRVIVVAALDNLVKGASGQAVQNMNIVCGLPENMGLQGTAIWP